MAAFSCVWAGGRGRGGGGGGGGAGEGGEFMVGGEYLVCCVCV